MGLDITLVRIISCCSLYASAGEGEKEKTPGVQMRIKGRGGEHMYSCVYFSEQPQVAVGLGAGGGQASPSCLGTEDLSAQPACTSHREA